MQIKKFIKILFTCEFSKAMQSDEIIDVSVDLNEINLYEFLSIEK